MQVAISEFKFFWLGCSSCSRVGLTRVVHMTMTREIFNRDNYIGNFLKSRREAENYEKKKIIVKFYFCRYLTGKQNLMEGVCNLLCRDENQ